MKTGAGNSRNRVHFAIRVHLGRRRALCGSDAGLKTSNVLPTSKEWRDVTCKLCLRSKPKGK